jgi:hypothetical protein
VKPFPLTANDRELGIPHPAKLVPLLAAIAGYCDEEIDSIDVRLRVHNEQWELLHGSSDYDQDHRGYWGASCIDGQCDLEAVAISLVEQVQDDAAESGAWDENAESES